jgi:hypothetical protein
MSTCIPFAALRRQPPIRGRQLDQRDGDREGKQHPEAIATSKPQPDCASGSARTRLDHKAGFIDHR